MHIGNDPIRNFSSYKYLGLHIDSFFSFDDMISHTCNKLRSRVAIIQRIRYLIPSDYLSSLYYAFIQPFIDYCILIWGHTSIGNVLRIQRFQNGVARIVADVFDFDVSGLSIVKLLGWLNVKQRRDYFFCTLVHKCLHNMAPFYLSDLLTFVNVISNRNTRQTDSNLLHVPFARINYYQKSFSVYGPVFGILFLLLQELLTIMKFLKRVVKIIFIVTNYLLVGMMILAGYFMYVLLNKEIYGLELYIVVLFGPMGDQYYYSCGLSTATIEYSCLSVCLCVCVSVCVCVCLCTR